MEEMLESDNLNVFTQDVSCSFTKELFNNTLFYYTFLFVFLFVDISGHGSEETSPGGDRGQTSGDLAAGGEHQGTYCTLHGC